MRFIIPLLVAILLALPNTGVRAQSCSLDVFGLDVPGPMTGSITNTGTVPFNASFVFLVDALPVSNGTLALLPGEATTVSNSFAFSPGNYQVTLRATASCGAGDAETVGHTVLEPFACFSPPGTDGQNFCDYQTQQYLVCQGGQWLSAGDTLDYYANCPLSCGDGVCGPGETAGTCPQDCSCSSGFINQFQCSGSAVQQLFQFADCSTEWRTQGVCGLGCSVGACKQPCREGFTPELQCNGNLREQQYLFADCSTTWIPQEYCSQSCTAGICTFPGTQTSPACNVSVKALDFVALTEKGETGHVTVTVAGSRGDANLTLFLNGQKKGSSSFTLPRGQDMRRTFFYTAQPGTYFGEVRASHACGTEDTATFTLTVTGGGTVLNFQSIEQPQPAAPQTAVTHWPGDIDVLLHAGKAVTVDIQSAIPQRFAIDVKGLPEGFISFKPSVAVQNQRGQAVLYITPDTPGTYHFTITVTAEQEQFSSSRTVSLFVAPPETAQQQNNFSLIIAFIVIASVVMIAVGLIYKKSLRNPFRKSDVRTPFPVSVKPGFNYRGSDAHRTG